MIQLLSVNSVQGYLFSNCPVFPYLISDHKALSSQNVQNQPGKIGTHVQVCEPIIHFEVEFSITTDIFNGCQNFIRVLFIHLLLIIEPKYIFIRGINVNNAIGNSGIFSNAMKLISKTCKVKAIISMA